MFVIVCAAPATPHVRQRIFRFSAGQHASGNGYQKGFLLSLGKQLIWIIVTSQSLQKTILHDEFLIPKGSYGKQLVVLIMFYTRDYKFMQIHTIKPFKP